VTAPRAPEVMPESRGPFAHRRDMRLITPALQTERYGRMRGVDHLVGVRGNAAGR
jgi:hypothetical protein